MLQHQDTSCSLLLRTKRVQKPDWQLSPLSAAGCGSFSAPISLISPAVIYLAVARHLLTVQSSISGSVLRPGVCKQRQTRTSPLLCYLCTFSTKSDPQATVDASAVDGASRHHSWWEDVPVWRCCSTFSATVRDSVAVSASESRYGYVLIFTQSKDNNSGCRWFNVAAIRVCLFNWQYVSHWR